jgi:hypothetical protein
MGEQMNYIPMDQMKSGHLYKIGARNASFGIWLEEEKGFIISRFKFSDNYLFVEYHWDTGAPHGTAKPWKDLGRVPFDYIPLLEVAKGPNNPIIAGKILEFLNHQGGDNDKDNPV